MYRCFCFFRHLFLVYLSTFIHIFRLTMKPHGSARNPQVRNLGTASIVDQESANDWSWGRIPGLVNIQKAIENGPVEIVDLPSYKMVMFIWFSIIMLVCQRVESSDLLFEVSFWPTNLLGGFKTHYWGLSDHRTSTYRNGTGTNNSNNAN